MALGSKDEDTPVGKKPGDDKPQAKEVSKPSPGVSDYLAGEARGFISNLQPYLPQELIGGSVPHIHGAEEEAVWNAAAQACGTEKVHFVYTADQGRVWYLACPSSAMASNPDSWCPLAAALPGNSEYWDRETVYLYEQEGVASALRWDPETARMQVFIGASRTILPRVQSMDANFVTINPDVADIAPWRNRMLKTEKLARATVRMLVFSGMAVSLIAILVLSLNYIVINTLSRDLDIVKEQTDQAAETLLRQAADVKQSDTIRHMVRIQELLDSLGRVDGTLVKYEVNKKGVKWEALIPTAFAKDFGKASELVGDGRVRVSNTR